MEQIALDTNIAIDLLNGEEEIIRALTPFEEICLPITVCGELLFGAINSGRPDQNSEKFKAFINTCCKTAPNLRYLLPKKIVPQKV